MTYSGGYSSGYRSFALPGALPATPAGRPAPLPDVWTFAAGPWWTMPLVELTNITARTCTWRLNGNHEASLTMNDTSSGKAPGLGPVSPAGSAAPATTTVAMRLGYGNVQGPYATSDTKRMAQIPYQVALLTGSAMACDLFAACELHEENDMDQLFAGRVQAADPDWALWRGGSGNQLLYRPSLYTISGGQKQGMTGGRSFSDFTVTHRASGAVAHVLVAHLRADDDNGRDRDKERESQIKFLAKYTAKMRNVVLVGDFNFQRDTMAKLRGILATSGLLGLQTRQPGLPNGDKDSRNGSNTGRFIDDIFTKSDQTIIDAAGVFTGPDDQASDHYLWMRATIGLTSATPYTPSVGHTPTLGEGGITELVWDLWVIRNENALFRGRFGPSSDTADGSGTIATQFSAADYRALLERRLLYEGDKLDYTNVEMSDVAWGLLSSTQSKTGGDLGIVRGKGTTTGVKRIDKFEAGSTVAASIERLSQTRNGFEWDIIPNVENPSMAFDLYYPARGRDRDVVLDYGGRVQSFTRGVDPAAFGNAVRGTGSDAVTPVRQEAPGLAYDPAGRWDLQLADDTITTALGLTERTARFADDSQYVEPSWSVVLTPGTWSGPDDFWLGDTVTLVVQAGRHDVVRSLRVVEFSVSLDDNDVATITVTLGSPSPKLRRTVRAIDKRLTAIERR